MQTSAAVTYNGLHDYYNKRGFKPTFASLKSTQDLDRYEHGRVALYRDLLGMPPVLFAGSRVCEYGPDTGENALIFARWGALLTLVEPNQAAWSDIRTYFNQFGLDRQLEGLIAETVETFSSPRPFDIINAEGFIYTVQPSESWLGRFAAQLNPEGFVVVNYLERSGCIFELLWSLMHCRYGVLVGRKDVETAFELFQTKWESIPHTRSFEAWVQDVLENPYVRFKYLLEPADLLHCAARAGLKFQTSWPRYEDPFHPYWHKRIPDELTLSARRDAYIERSRLSFALSRPLFVVGDFQATKAINRAVLDLGSAVDGLIDNWTKPLLSSAFSALEVLDAALASSNVMADSENRTEGQMLLHVLRHAIEVMEEGDAAAIRRFAGSDSSLIGAWGATTHYVVLRRTTEVH